MPRILCTTVHATSQDPDTTACRQVCCGLGLAATDCDAPLQCWWIDGDSGREYRRVFSPQLVEPHCGFLQGSGVRARGVPAVDQRQQRVGACTLALLPPQVCQAPRRAPLPGLRLLDTGFRLIHIRHRCSCASQPMASTLRVAAMGALLTPRGPPTPPR
jgi:hypothetical protein